MVFLHKKENMFLSYAGNQFAGCQISPTQQINKEIALSSLCHAAWVCLWCMLGPFCSGAEAQVKNPCLTSL